MKNYTGGYTTVIIPFFLPVVTVDSVRFLNILYVRNVQLAGS